jgi:hypothetical protein
VASRHGPGWRLWCALACEYKGRPSSGGACDGSGRGRSASAQLNVRRAGFVAAAEDHLSGLRAQTLSPLSVRLSLQRHELRRYMKHIEPASDQEG